MNKHILYVSHILPKQGTGGWIVMFRPLQRLEESGWKISIIAPEQVTENNQIPNSWNLIEIPSRRWWWLPVKNYLFGSLSLRIFFWMMECRKYLINEKPNAILTILGDNYNLLAKSLSIYLDIPLSLIIHDDIRLRSQSVRMYRNLDKFSRNIIKHSAKIWVVSQEMQEAFHLNKTLQNVSVLRPIPEGGLNFVEWQNSFFQYPVIAHAGSLYEFHIEYFQKVANILKLYNGRLLIVADKSNSALIKLQSLCDNIIHKEQFRKNIDVINFLRTAASCMLVCYPYPVSKHIWSKTSFPSRMIEFMHLGLPYLIIGDSSTALGKWAIANNWQGYISDPNDYKNLKQFIDKITQKHEWLQMSQRSRQVAMEEFDSYRIHQQFEAELARKV